MELLLFASSAMLEKADSSAAIVSLGGASSLALPESCIQQGYLSSQMSMNGCSRTTAVTAKQVSDAQLHVQGRNFPYADADEPGCHLAAHGSSRQGAKIIQLAAGTSSGVAISSISTQRELLTCKLQP